jgi:hypothetical protein
MQYNVEWLFLDYYAASDCPGNGCSWKNSADAKKHMGYVSDVIRTLKPDILNLCEVEGCDELSDLCVDSQYKPYMVKGQDTSTGQNVGLLTLIDPAISLYRTDERVKYPIPGSTCGYTGEPSDSGVSKHYITEYKLGDLNVAMIGVHLVAFPTDPARCAQREAQAQVIQNVVASYVNKGYEIVVLGDCKLPVGLNAESDSVHPAALLPDTIRVLEPLIHIPMVRAGVPVVILSTFPEI